MVGEAGTDYPRIHIIGTPLPLRPAMMGSGNSSRNFVSYITRSDFFDAALVQETLALFVTEQPFRSR